MYTKDIIPKLKKLDIKLSEEGNNTFDSTKNDIVKSAISGSRSIRYNFQSLCMEELMFSVIKIDNY